VYGDHVATKPSPPSARPMLRRIDGVRDSSSKYILANNTKEEVRRDNLMVKRKEKKRQTGARIVVPSLSGLI